MNNKIKIVECIENNNNKMYCYYCKNNFNKGYLKKHLETKKHKKNVEKGNGYMLNRTKKYNYNLEVLLNNVKEKYLVKEIVEMSLKMDLIGFENKIVELNEKIKVNEMSKTKIYMNWSIRNIRLKKENILYWNGSGNITKLFLETFRTVINKRTILEDINENIGLEIKLIKNLIFEINMKYFGGVERKYDLDIIYESVFNNCLNSGDFFNERENNVIIKFNKEYL